MTLSCKRLIGLVNYGTPLIAVMLSEQNNNNNNNNNTFINIYKQTNKQKGTTVSNFSWCRLTSVFVKKSYFL